MDGNVKIEWSWCDIQSLEEDWDEEKCKKALSIVGRKLEEFSIQAGWSILENLLDTYSEEIEE